MGFLPSILLQRPCRECYNTDCSNDHPGDQYSKVLPQMVFGTEDDSSRCLDGVKEREAIAIAVKVGHNLQGSEGACDVDNNPEAEEVAGPFEADKREE